MPPPLASTLVPLHARAKNSSQYAWNAKTKKIVKLAQDGDGDVDAGKGHRHPARYRHPGPRQRTVDFFADLQSSFFPSADQVTPDYWEYIKWRGWHRLFSSMSSIFSTQSLLLAVGVGARNTLPAAAGINWVLKDGLGRLGRLTVATKFGESFDADLKRFRFASSFIYAGALLIENLTPYVPQYFLPMAAIANVGKSVGLTTYISTQPAFYKSFARAENIADISAKSQAQQMAIDTLGLALAVSLNLSVKRNASLSRMLPLIMFPILVPGDLFSIYHELRSVHLRTLNVERAELLAAAYVDDIVGERVEDRSPIPRGGRGRGHATTTHEVLTPEEISKMERFVMPSAARSGAYPLEIRGLDGREMTAADVAQFEKARRGKKYLLTGEGGVRDEGGEGGADVEGKGWIATRRRKYTATFRADCTSTDILQVLLTMAYLRRETRREMSMDEAERFAARRVGGFVRGLKARGWQCDPFTLSKTERTFYHVL